jgi:Fe-S-cluster-containing dehydrogenase component
MDKREWVLMNVKQGILIDYEYCTGCGDCERVCQAEHGFQRDEWGIKIAKIGPWQAGDGRWQYDFVPIPTDQCDLCADRVRQGKKPACVKHCQAAVITHGALYELAASMKTKPKMVLFTPKMAGERSPVAVCR